MERKPPRGPDAPHEIGYCKPPKHTRFKPGQSGHPSGRPRGQLNFRTAVGEALKEKITIREGDRTRNSSCTTDGGVLSFSVARSPPAGTHADAGQREGDANDTDGHELGAYYVDKDLKYWNHGEGLHYELGQTLDFTTRLPYLSREGWSSPESQGTWSKGAFGRLLLELNGIGKPTEIRFTATPFLAPQLDAQRIVVWANGVKLGEATLTSPTAKEISFAVGPSVTLRNGRELEICFEYPDAKAPDALGISTDAWRAFYFRTLVMR